MNTDVYVSITPMAEPAPGCTAELERLGDEIAELSAHLDAATARLLELIREFDARAGWNTGFRSCAEWLSWRGGGRPRAPRGRGRGPPAPPPPPRWGPPRAGGGLFLPEGRAPPPRPAPPPQKRPAPGGRA